MKNITVLTVLTIGVLSCGRSNPIENKPKIVTKVNKVKPKEIVNKAKPSNDSKKINDRLLNAEKTARDICKEQEDDNKFDKCYKKMVKLVLKYND